MVELMFCELGRSLDYPVNSGNLLCLCEKHENKAMSLQIFILRTNI